MQIDGQCHCGSITFEAEVDPEEVSGCHCTDCQTLTGSPMRGGFFRDPRAPNFRGRGRAIA